MNVLLSACNYSDKVTQNTLLILVAIAVIFIIWLMLAVKDLLCRLLCRRDSKYGRKRHEPCCQNFLTRFCYEFFLEFCIAICISITVYQAEGILDSSFDQAIAVFLAALVIGMIIFVTSLLACKGPYIDNYYQRGTLLQSLWSVRPIASSFDAKAHLMKG